MAKIRTIDAFIGDEILSINKVGDKNNYPQLLKNYLYLVISGTKLFLGDKYTKMIDKVLDKINFYYGESGYKNIKKIFSFSNWDIKEAKCLGMENNKVVKYYVYIPQNDKHKDNIEFLITTFMQILGSFNNTFIYKDNKVFFRNGLSIMEYENNLIIDNKDLSTLNTIFEVYNTEKIMKTILSYKESFKQNEDAIEVLSYLDTLDYNSYSLKKKDNLKALFKPLLDDESFVAFINECILEGDIERIELIFNEAFGNNDYESFNNDLNDISIKLDYLKKDIKDSYDVSSLYLKIKNEYIKDLSVYFGI